MNQKSKFLLATISGLLVSTSAIAQTEPPRTYGNVTIQKSENSNNNRNYQNSPNPYSQEDFEDTGDNGYMEIGNVNKEPSRADRLRSMEDEVVQKVNPNAKQEEQGQQPRSPEEFAKQEGIKTAPQQETKEDKEVQQPAKKVIVPQKKPGIVYGSISNFNTQTIQQTENEARQRDSANYQEFLKEAYKK